MKRYQFEEFEIIDAHSHIYPEKIAQKATGAVSEFYDIPMYSIGSVQKLIESGKQINVKKYLVCSAATTANQVFGINNYIKAQCDEHDEFFGFGTLHPDFEDIQGEVDRMVEMGLHGIKLHPDFQKFDIDSKSAYKIYEAAQGRLPILFHTGDNRYDYSLPSKLAKVQKDFPELKSIAAHLGGYKRWEEALESLCGLNNVMFDCSSSMSMLQPDYAVKIMRRLGIDNIMFGTDFPMWSHISEAEFLLSLNFEKSELEKIFSGNFKRFFNMD